MRILVTGANGFVGDALIPRLLDEGHDVVALVRSKGRNKKLSQVKWLQGDLLKPGELPELGKIDHAYYLVHGLKGKEESFEYFEALAAVNFINWIRPTGAGIIYLGGLGPDKEELSPHLRSRHLTGAILGCSGLGLIEFRASIILGEGSLSFEMIKAMAERFPVRPKFPLLHQPCQPLAKSDLLNYLLAALEFDHHAHEIFEIGGPDVTTYGELLDLYAKVAKLKRKKVKLPEVDSRILMKILDYAIPEHAQMGRKLLESLSYATTVNSGKSLKTFPDLRPKTLKLAMSEAYAASKSHYPPMWEKDFLKLIAQSGLLSPDLLRNLERVGKVKKIFSGKKK